MWVGTFDGLALLTPSGLQAPWVPLPSPLTAVVMHLDSKGRLWIGRRAGGVLVWDFDTDSVRSLGAAEGISDQTVWDISEDASGTIWVATNGDGVVAVGEEGTRRITTREGLPDNVAWQVQPDRQGGVWIYSSRGLSRLFEGHLVSYGPADGLIDLEGSATAALADETGQVWFGSGSGLTVVNPNLVRNRPPPPPIYVESLVADGQAIDLPEAVVPPRPDVVVARFSAPSLRDESGTRFRYRLRRAGEEPQAWSDLQVESEVRLAGLGPGQWVLECLAESREGTRSLHPAEVRFTVAPAYWQTIWFWALVGLVVVGSAVSIPVMRARVLERERVRLQELVELHTRDIEEKNRRLQEEISEREALTVLQAQLEKKLIEAERLQALGRMAGGIAHDFNNLLAAILGNALLVSEEADLAPALRSDILEIVDAANRGSTLVAQLLAYVRRQVVQPRRVDVGRAVEGMRGLLASLLGDAVALSLEVAAPEPEVLFDPGHLDQILLNLASNAKDAMPKGGEFRISVRNERLAARRGEPGPDVVPEGSYVVVTVEDTGEGMDAETLRHAFDPFFTTKREGEGTGLGLSTVRGILTQAGGYLHVRSAVGEGTRFDLYIPAVAEPATARVDPGGSALVVIGDPALLDNTARAVAAAGLDLTVRNTWDSDAFEAVRRQASFRNPALVVLDVAALDRVPEVVIDAVFEPEPRVRVVLFSDFAPDALKDEFTRSAYARLVPRTVQGVELEETFAELVSPPSPANQAGAATAP